MFSGYTYMLHMTTILWYRRYRIGNHIAYILYGLSDSYRFNIIKGRVVGRTHKARARRTYKRFWSVFLRCHEGLTKIFVHIFCRRTKDLQFFFVNLMLFSRQLENNCQKISRYRAILLLFTVNSVKAIFRVSDFLAWPILTDPDLDPDFDPDLDPDLDHFGYVLG